MQYAFTHLKQLVPKTDVTHTQEQTSCGNHHLNIAPFHSCTKYSCTQEYLRRVSSKEEIIFKTIKSTTLRNKHIQLRYIIV